MEALVFLFEPVSAWRRFRIPVVHDDYCPECLCLIADTSVSPMRVANELNALVRLDSKPAGFVSVNGTEFASRPTLKWADENGIDWLCIDPGKPLWNAFIENSNRSLRDEH